MDAAVDCARQAGRQVIIAGPEDIHPDLRHVTDDGRGPLSGIVATLKQRIDERYIFMPCDMPALTPGLLIQLGQAMDDHDAAICRNQDSEQMALLPLAVHARTLDAAQATLAGPRRSIYAFLANIGSIELGITDDEQSQLLNINHPTDWERYLAAFGT